jgi:hypothetical protein
VRDVAHGKIPLTKILLDFSGFPHIILGRREEEGPAKGSNRAGGRERGMWGDVLLK